MTPAIFASIILALWALYLAHPRLAWTGWDLPARYIAAAGAVWFLLNFFAWMVPKWRTYIVTTRGPLLGLGFAFAAALVSTVVDARIQGAGLAIFFWRLAVLAVPFTWALMRRLKPYPHWTDLLAVALAWLLPRVPGFGGAWFVLGGIGVGPGRLIGLALLATYFYGARPWTAAALDWKARRGDAAFALQMGALAASGAILGHLAARIAGLIPPGSPVELPADLGFFLLGLTLAPAAEELAFRAILQSGIAKLLPKKVGESRRLWAAAAAAAALHAVSGPYGLSAGAAVGFALGMSIAYRKVNRLLPALLGHAGAWAVLVASSLATL